MEIKKLLQIFLGSWAVLIFLMFVTGDMGLGPAAQVICTGVLAALITLLAVVAARGGRKGTTLSVYVPGEAGVRYRVEGEWIYKGAEESPGWYIKRGAVYSFQSMTPLYRIKDGKLYREGEQAPVWTVEDGKVISAVSGQVEFEIK